MRVDRDGEPSVSCGVPVESGDGRAQRTAPQRQIVKIIRLDGAVAQQKQTLEIACPRLPSPLFPALHRQQVNVEFVGQLLLGQAPGLSPCRKFHIGCPKWGKPKWLYETGGMWQDANMASSNIVYIRRVANDYEAPNRIRELREAKGLTQSDLARLIHVHPTALNKIERGSRGLDQEWMRRLAPHLGVTPAELLPVEDNPYLLTDRERALIDRLREAGDTHIETFGRVADLVIPFRGQPNQEDAA